jgi:3-oxoadipate enol-lactonase
MPKATVGNIDINYKIQGQGEPLLLIIGLSFSLLDWGIKLPDLLSQHYKVILFDNRDAGETSRSPDLYTLAQMASDAAGLLDALGEPKAHVFGVSMGGMIAQHFALNHADQLNKLILGCTMAGGGCSQAGAIGSFLSDDLLNWTVRSSRKINEFARVPAPKVVQGAQSLKRSHNKAYRGSA